MHKRYIVTILPDDSGTVRKYSLHRKHIRFLIGGAVVFAAFFAFLMVHFFVSTNQQLRLNRVQKELQVLKEVNSKYQQSAEQLEERLNFFSDKARKLATYVGAEVSLDDSEIGIGGADYLNNQYSAYLNKDLDGMDRKADKLFEGFKALENIYKDKQDVLRHTPSIWPVKGFFTDRYGYRKDPFTGLRDFHSGIDISAKRGTPIFAPADGIISKVGKSKGLGNTVVISHLNNMQTRYGHMQEILVKKGQSVKRGDVIGTVGNTGRSTGPHLHFEVLVQNKTVDPADYIISEIMHF